MSEAVRRIAEARMREQRRRALLKTMHYTRIVVAYVLASLAAGLVLTMCVVSTDLQAFTMAIERGTIAVAPLLFSFFILIVAAIPALVLIVIAERMRIRGAIYYVAVCAILAVAAYLSLFETEPQAPGTRIPAWLLVSASFALSGAAAGLVYWAVAGRKAGRKKRQPDEPQPAAPSS